MPHPPALRTLSLSSPAARCVLGLTAALLLLGLLGGGQAQVRLERPIGPGARLLRWTDETGPFALQAVEVDLGEPFLSLGVSLGVAGADGATLGLEPLSGQAERLTRPERYAIAGVNGDFFYYPGRRQPGAPTGAAFLGEELVRTPLDRSCLVVPAQGPPDIRIYRADAAVTLPGGGTVRLAGVNQPRGPGDAVLYTPRWGGSTRTDAAGVEVYLAPVEFPLRAGVAHEARVRAVQVGVGDGGIQTGAWVLSAAGEPAAALKTLAPGDPVVIRVAFDPPVRPGDQLLGGGPRLLRGGRVSIEREAGSLGEAFARTRHPRTAVGYRRDRLYLLVADGRQPGHSLGMSLEELAQAMLALGCTDAINLDGGGSSTLWVRGGVINRPSDGRERAVANGLLLFSTAPRGPAVRLVGPDGGLNLLAGAAAPLVVTGEDRHYNPAPVAPETLRWRVEPDVGVLRDGRFAAAADTLPPPGAEFAPATLTLSAAGAEGVVPIRVYARPARLDLRPGTARLAPSSQAVFRVRALDSRGAVLASPPVRWTADAAVGSIAADGTLTTAGPGRGVVRAEVNGVAVEAPVEVAVGVRAALEDFEDGAEWAVRLAGAAGRVQVAEGVARSGRRALRLDYDFSLGSGTRAVYALGQRNLGRPFALKVWVRGDGQGAWLRTRIRDAKGTTHLFDLARRVDWANEWREVRLPFSDDLPAPLTLEALYVVETDSAAKPRGTLFLDDLTIEE